MFFDNGPNSEIREQAQKSFFPALILRSSYWKGWLTNIDAVVGYPALIGSVLGLVTLRTTLPRVFLAGLWGGYFLFGLIFTDHISNHDYYSLQLIPIVALSLGPFMALLMKTFVLSRAHNKLRTQLAAGIFFLMAALATIPEVKPRIASPASENTVINAREIGGIVGHSERTLFISGSYGKPLKYYGDLAGTWWPQEDEFPTSNGRRESSTNNIQERFNMVATKYNPEYFIVTKYKEFEKQNDLKNFLTKTFRLIARTDEYLVFDLRKRIN
jgi:hypothetical protein